MTAATTIIVALVSLGMTLASLTVPQTKNLPVKGTVIIGPAGTMLFHNGSTSHLLDQWQMPL